MIGYLNAKRICAALMDCGDASNRGRLPSPRHAGSGLGLPMLFSSLSFLIWFLPIVLILHALLPAVMRNAFLLLASIFFYAWGEIR
jgi:hypothetical protein